MQDEEADLYSVLYGMQWYIHIFLILQKEHRRLLVVNDPASEIIFQVNNAAHYRNCQQNVFENAMSHENATESKGCQ